MPGEGVSPTNSEKLTENLRLAPGPRKIDRLGPFRVVKLLGAGGMGAVYQAVDTQLARLVALKVLHPSLVGSKRARERFLREARATAALEHDHVVPIYQIGADKGIPYLAMPLLRGQSLADRLQAGLRLSQAEVLRIAREIAEGLAAAHAHGLIHRDIKPGNIWLEEGSGRVKILDFGLSRRAEESTRLTRDGTILGTLSYMAPEQASGSGNVDHRSDLFSLGNVLYRMSTGQKPFTASSTVALRMKLLRDDPVPPRQLNPEMVPGLNDLIMRLMAKDPSARPQSARLVVKAIQALEHPRAGVAPAIAIDIGDEAPDSSALRPQARAEPRRPGQRWLSAVLVTVMLAIGVLVGIEMLPRLRNEINDQGELILESSKNAVAVAVKHEGRVGGVLDSRVGPALHLKAGTYELVLSETTETLKLASERLTLGRGERKSVGIGATSRP